MPLFHFKLPGFDYAVLGNNMSLFIAGPDPNEAILQENQRLRDQIDDLRVRTNRAKQNKTS